MKQINYLLIITLCLLAPPSSLAGQLLPGNGQDPAGQAAPRPSEDDAVLRPSTEQGAPPASELAATPRQPARKDDIRQTAGQDAPRQPVEEGARQKENGEVWVRLESGAKPAYVGIQGGTAPSSLLRATDGSLFFFTGNTGNDFTQVLGGGGKHNGTRLPAGDERALSAAKEEMHPFGLSNPEGLAPEAEEPHETEAVEEAAALKPLRLKSYKDLLEYGGSL